MSQPDARRTWLLGLTATWGLSACGFALRRAPELRFRTLMLSGFRPRSPLAQELRQNINASTTTLVVDSLAQSQVVLEVVEDAREKVVVASSSAGQVTEFQLRARFTFTLKTPGGRELAPQSRLAQSRDLSYTESAALAKEQEEAFLYRAMQSDIVAQVMRQLAFVPAQ
jgi:LPS-assembly lipoprotein